MKKDYELHLSLTEAFGLLIHELHELARIIGINMPAAEFLNRNTTCPESSILCVFYVSMCLSRMNAGQVVVNGKSR